MGLKLALIGHPVEHSLSPLLHGAALSFWQLDGSYELLDTKPEALGKAVDRLVAEHFAGFNVTVPHKQSVLDLLDRLSPEASLAGAVNTVRLDSSGCKIGHNTDIRGFVLALERLSGLVRGRAVVLGAGGAARACLCGLAMAGYRWSVVVARREETARALCRELSPRLPNLTLSSSGTARLSRFAPCDLLVNCTPIGLTGDNPPSWFDEAASLLDGAGTFFDTVYRKDARSTPLARQAARHGAARVTSGLDMLVGQAATAFELWTSRSVPWNVMVESLPLQPATEADQAISDAAVRS